MILAKSVAVWYLVLVNDLLNKDAIGFYLVFVAWRRLDACLNVQRSDAVAAIAQADKISIFQNVDKTGLLGDCWLFCYEAWRHTSLRFLLEVRYQ